MKADIKNVPCNTSRLRASISNTIVSREEVCSQSMLLDQADNVQAQRHSKVAHLRQAAELQLYRLHSLRLSLSAACAPQSKRLAHTLPWLFKKALDMLAGSWLEWECCSAC